jgi:hypothetical protein
MFGKYAIPKEEDNALEKAMMEALDAEDEEEGNEEEEIEEYPTNYYPIDINNRDLIQFLEEVKDIDHVNSAVYSLENLVTYSQRLAIFIFMRAVFNPLICFKKSHVTNIE